MTTIHRNDGEEQKYLQKCKELKRRIREIEDHNDAMALSIARTKRSIQRIRLERALLLEKLEERTLFKVDDSDGTVSPPLSPIEDGEHQDHHEDVHAESSGAKKRVPPPRNPNLPKRPQNAYIIFCEVEKDRVRNELEHIQPGEPFDLTKAMAEAWKDLDPKGKSPFYALYEDDKIRYYREMAAYSDPNATPSEVREKQRAIKALRDLENKEKLSKEHNSKHFPMSDGPDDEHSEIPESEDVKHTDDEDIDVGSENFHIDESDEEQDDGYDIPDSEPPSSMGIEPGES
jgi:non-histone protein 10